MGSLCGAITGDHLGPDMDGEPLFDPRDALQLARQLAVASCLLRVFPAADVGIDDGGALVGGRLLAWPEADQIARDVGLGDVLTAIDQRLAAPERKFVLLEVHEDAQVAAVQDAQQLALGTAL